MCPQMEILKDKDVWIADSGATSHNTPHDIGVHSVQKPWTSDNVTVGNGAETSASKVGTINGSMYDKNGQLKIRNASLKDVIVLPGSKFNLISIPVFLEKGWQLTGDSEKVKLVKDGVELLFDMTIKTKRGALHCMNFKREILKKGNYHE